MVQSTNYFGFQPLSVLNINAHNLEETWKLCEQKFDLYLLASSSSEIPEKVQVAILLAAIGDDALRVFNTFTFTDAAHKEKLDEVRKSFREYCSPRKRSNHGKVYVLENNTNT